MNVVSLVIKLTFTGTPLTGNQMAMLRYKVAHALAEQAVGDTGFLPDYSSQDLTTIQVESPDSGHPPLVATAAGSFRNYGL